MKSTIINELTASASLKEKIAKELSGKVKKAAELLIKALKDGKMIFFMGNGGSAADAQHLAAELVGRFKKERTALPAIALSTNTSVLTSLGNDYGFESVFKRQVEALGKPGDVLFSISTSGKSPNLVAALKTAQKMGLTTISLSGKGGGPADKSGVNLSIIIPSNDTPRIQEAQITIGHILCGLIEDALFNGK